MQTQGKIADVPSARLKTWQPEEVLFAPDANTIRYSRGFLRAKPEIWFEALSSHWAPLFHTLGSSISVTGVRTSLDFPENLDRVTPVEIDGETCIIGLDTPSITRLVGAVSEGARDAAALVIIEYLERRFLSTLSMSWKGNSSLTCHFIPPERTDAVEVVGVVTVEFSIDSIPCALHLGLGPRLLDRLDFAWREHLISSAQSQSGNAGEREDLINVSVELIELAVPPAMLIDYVRSGTVINLDIPVSPTVLVRANGEIIARGELVQCNGRYAVQLADVNFAPERSSNSTTRVQVEIARTELDRESFAEYLQPGAILLTRTSLNPTAILVISGEDVASAVVSEIDGQFALNVLPK